VSLCYNASKNNLKGRDYIQKS